MSLFICSSMNKKKEIFSLFSRTNKRGSESTCPDTLIVFEIKRNLWILPMLAQTSTVCLHHGERAGARGSGMSLYGKLNQKSSARGMLIQVAF